MKKRSNLTVMMRLIGLVKPLTGYMILAVLLGVIGFLCAIFITIFGGWALLDALHMESPIPMAAAFAIAISIAVARGFLRYGEQACNHYIAFKLLALIRDHVFKALRKLCPAKLEGKGKGNLISVITSDIELLEVFYAHTISPILIAFSVSVIMIGFIMSIHWVLGLVALAAYLVVGVAVPMIVSKMSGDTGNQFREQSGSLSSFVLDSLRGLGESIQYQTGKKRLEELDSRTDSLTKEEEKQKKYMGRNMAITNTIILIFSLLMLTAASLLYVNNMISFEGLLISVIAMMSSFGPVVALANLGSTLQNTFAAGNRVLDILEETPLTEDITGKPAVSFTGVQVENVTFAYDKEVVLSDISMAVPKNKIVGIVGKSGSGKSTLLKLMMRFWKVQQGKVEISNTNIEEINTDNLRDMESLVTQETHLFHASIAQNLRIAKQDATQEELEQACKKASIHEFIMSLPNGYETQVGELGDTLSGGEKQRLGLARAFLHNAPFILLDEPTSNLDSLNEAVILKSLHQASDDKTVVLISHRVSTMKIADDVYNVERGRMS